MVTTSTATQQKPTAITEIERLGFSWTEVADFDYTQLSTERRVQVRELSHYAPKDAVQRYAIMMGETKFPPIIVTSDDWIVDGNTRVGARLLRKEKFNPAIVLDVAYKGSSRELQNQLHALAATLNASQGVPLTSREIREVAVRLVELGWLTEAIGRAIGLKPSSVTQVKREIAAAAKMRKVGLDPNGSVKGPSLRALGAKDVLALNDVPYKELATLAVDAGLNASEIVDTAKQAKATGSDEGALGVVSQLRTEFGDRIREMELTGPVGPPNSRRLRQHLGFITKFFNREQELLETDPKVSEQHMQAITDSINVLNEVLRMQKGG
jgi:hypothetical protein